MKALRPIGAAEFILAPRQLPPIKAIEVRLDSSLRALGVEVRIKVLPQLSIRVCVSCRRS